LRLDAQQRRQIEAFLRALSSEGGGE
jgi:hypothetical protein